ncbi:MAG: outer membrane protein assembly factor BamB family protein [Acidimicrobiales bacterium]
MCEPLWTLPASSEVGPNVSNGVLYVTDDISGRLEAFDAAGTTNCSGVPRTCAPLWTASIDSVSVPSVSGGRVYVTTRSGSGAIVAFDAGGVQRCSGSPTVCTPLFTIAMPAPSIGSVAVSGSVVYAQTTTNILVAGDAKGTACLGVLEVCDPTWVTNSVGGSATGHATPTVSGGRVFVLFGFGTSAAIEEFDANGAAGCSFSPHRCNELWDTGPFVSRLGPLTTPVATNGLVFGNDQAWAPHANPGCNLVIMCVPAWSAPAESQSYGPTVAHATLYERTSSPSPSIVAYRLH